MERELGDIRYLSRTHKKLQSLMNRVSAESIKAAHRKQESGKATGIDGIAKAEYGEKLNENAADLIERMKKFSYKPLPVRRTYIPKADGKLRPLGIPAYEDRLVQSVMADILSDIYEERFLDYSYGYRPDRSQHDAVKIINDTIMGKKAGYVLEADIKGFFDNVDHEWLMKFLGNDIEDKNFLRYVKRFLIAGIMEDGEYRESEKGTPQGGLISPILANVYLHYVLDLWFDRVLKKECKGEVYYIRFADDFLLIFQYESEAKQALDALRERLRKFGLELSEEKTRIIPFGRYKGGKDDFDFLGFTFYNTTTMTGKYRTGIRTSKKKMKVKRQVIKAWLWEQIHKPIAETMKKLAVKVKGHYNYYGVNGNSKMLYNFWVYVKYVCWKAINRRSQKRSMKTNIFERIWTYYIPPPRLTINIWTMKPKLV